MRMFFVIAILIITATSAFALSKDSSCRGARRSGALAKIKIHVVDDLGHIVSNADVSVFFFGSSCMSVGRFMPPPDEISLCSCASERCNWATGL